MNDALIETRKYLLEVGFQIMASEPDGNLVCDKAKFAIDKYIETFNERFTKGEGLIFTGGYGVGKTCAMAYFTAQLLNLPHNTLLKGYMDAPEIRRRVRYFNAYDMFATFADFSTPEVRRIEINKMLSATILLIDDFGTEFCTKGALSEFNHLIDSRHGDRLPTFFTTNLKEETLGSAPELKRAFERINATNSWITIIGKNQRAEKKAKADYWITQK